VADQGRRRSVRVKIRFILLAVAATVTAGALAKLADRPNTSAGQSGAAMSSAQSARDMLAADPGFPLTVSDVGPEETLARIFTEIEGNRLNNALQLTEALIRQHPNYRLANLIKGDLLLARAQPIRSFGALNDAPADKVADLRAEAIARLKAYREKPPADFVPRYLLQIQPDQRYAIVVDTQRSRLYLYENDRSHGGQPRFIADYYGTQGKLGAEKGAEGAKKTPVGVYHVTANLPRQKLADLYGSGAYPLNYPNEWDKRQGRSGSGIWLHGTPSDTFARPPRASDEDRRAAHKGPQPRRRAGQGRRQAARPVRPAQARRETRGPGQAVRARHQRADARPDVDLPLRRARHLPADDHARGTRRPQEGHERGLAQRAPGQPRARRPRGRWQPR